MASQSTGLSLSKWHIALLVGTPIAIGLGYYYFSSKDATNAQKELDELKKTRSKSSTKAKKTTGENGKEAGNSGTSGSAASTPENDSQSFNKKLDQESPLKQAINFKNDGNGCYRKGKYDEAIKFYDKAIDICPVENNIDLAIFYQNRAAAYEMLKRWSQVKSDCTKSLEYNPKYAKAYFRRAKAHEQTKDLLNCLDDITATCILEVFQNQQSIMFADRILKLTGKEDAIKGMQNRVPMLPSKHFIRTYFRSFVADPVQLKDISKCELKGFARAKKAIELEYYDDVIIACTEEIESSESESQFKNEALLLRATFYLLNGSFLQAKQDLDTLINNEEVEIPIRINAFIKRASLNIQMENKDDGLLDFEQAEKLDPTNPDIYHQRAQVYTLLDQLDKALSDYEKAIQLAPTHIQAYLQKCYAEYRLSCVEMDRARMMTVMNEFKNVVEKYPDCVEGYSLLAQVLCEQGQYEQADSFFEKAIKLSPHNAALFVHRGVMQLQWNGDINKAIEYMNKSIEIDEKCEFAYETLGTIEVQRTNLEKSVELFEKAIKYAKSQTEMAHLYALRNAAIAQINVTKKLGIDISAISALASGGLASTN